MCEFKSAICLKDRVFVPDYDSHDRMLKELKIPDTEYHAEHTFVRVELSPADGDMTSDPMGWKIRIDQDILPDWFVHKVDEERVKVAVADWCKVHVLRRGKHEVHEGVWIAYDSATVTAYDSATVKAYNSATVTAYGSATVKAYDSATVIIPKSWGTSKPVQLNGNAICVNHRDKTVKSASKWTMEG